MRATVEVMKPLKVKAKIMMVIIANGKQTCVFLCQPITIIIMNVATMSYRLGFHCKNLIVRMITSYLEL